MSEVKLPIRMANANERQVPMKGKSIVITHNDSLTHKGRKSLNKIRQVPESERKTHQHLIVGVIKPGESESTS